MVFQVSIVDAWKEHTPYPFNQLPKSYSFLVKHESLWKIAFYSTKPRFVHQPQMAATSALVARDMAKMLDKHRPDLIVSVHPLMQVSSCWLCPTTVITVVYQRTLLFIREIYCHNSGVPHVGTYVGTP